MKSIKIISRICAVILAVCSIAIFSLVAVAEREIAESYFVVEGKQLNIGCQIPITTHYNGTEESQSSLVENSLKSDYSVNFKLFGLIPVKKASVSVIDDMSVVLLGEPFGMKIYTDGVLVVDMSDVDSENGSVNPAKSAGIKIGDTIKSINGVTMRSNEDVSRMVETSDGSPMTICYMRENVIKTTTLTPVYSKSAGAYRIGLWVRDSTAGIGTLTFFSPAIDIMCGLGHGVCDDDTGQLINISSGELVNAQIVSIKKGIAGSPGELKGKLGNQILGKMLLNCECGVFAKKACPYEDAMLVNLALKQEIKEGEALIYTTIDGATPDYYTCNIKINAKHENERTQNMIVTVTDKRLLEKTGGIVQGMSGSPILQDGRLIGAVTHVFVNNPQKGYGIFAENMLSTAQSLAKKIEDKAS